MNKMRILFSTIYININSHMDEINRNVIIKPLKRFNLVTVLANEVYYCSDPI